MSNPEVLLVLRNHPTRQAAKRNDPTIGKDFETLMRLLRRFGWTRSQLRFEYVVPVFQGKYSADDLEKYAERLENAIAEIKPDRILSLGNYGHMTLIEQLHTKKGRKLQPTKHIRGAVHLYKGIPMISTIPIWRTRSDSFWWRDILFDLEKFSAPNIRPVAPPKLEIVECDTSNQLRKALRRLKPAPVIAFDIETTGLNMFQDPITAIGFGAALSGERGLVIICTHKLLRTNDAAEYDAMRSILARFLQGKSHKGILVAHNGKFDMRFLQRLLPGYDLYNPQIRDTLLLNYMIDERNQNSTTIPHGLKRLARDYFDDSDYGDIEFEKYSVANMAEMEEEEQQRLWDKLHKYLAKDVYYTASLYIKLWKRLQAECPEAQFVYEQILCPANAVLASVEVNGAPVNPQTFESLTTHLESEIEYFLENIRATLQDTEYEGWEEFNVRSSKQVLRAMYDHFRMPDIGAGRTSKAEIVTKLLHQHGHKLGEHAVNFLENLAALRRTQKIVSTYSKPLTEKGASGTLYGQYNLAGTSTGRLSSEKPNFQNMPNMAGNDIRSGFEAPPGWVWLKADYSQLELRVAAHESKDQNMIRAFTEGRDIHSEVASAMFGIRPEEVTKEQRFAAKFVDFGILYGRRAASIANGKELMDYGWTVAQAQMFIDNYLDEFSGLRDWMTAIQEEAVRNQFLVTATGRYRRWPVLTDQILWESQRQALNFPIQSLASDITVTAMIKVFEWIRKTKHKARIVASVHDEIDLIVHWTDLDIVAKNVIHIMKTSAPVEFSVPLKADVEIGPNWAALEDWKEGKMPDFIKDTDII